MLTFAKILFIIVGGIFLVSYLNSGKFSLTGDRSFGTLSDRDTYMPSYDANDDGVISDREYERGELRRIEEEIENLREELAQELAEHAPSPYADMVSVSRGSADESDPDVEFIEIEANYDNRRSVTITGWQLKSIASGKTITIPRGSWPGRDPGLQNGLRDLALKKDESAIILSGDITSRERFERQTGNSVEDVWIAQLRSSKELWRNSSDAIIVLDKDGLVVDSITY